MRLGTRSIRTLALSFSVVSTSRNRTSGSFDFDTFWSQSLAAAFAAKTLSRETNIGTPNEVFVCGLLAKVGRLALASVYPEEYAEVEERARMLAGCNYESSEELANLERQQLEITHIELTATMLDDWGLPEVFREAVLHQDEPPSAVPDEQKTLDRVLHVANLIAWICVADDEQAMSHLDLLVPQAEQLGLDIEELSVLCEEVGEQWQQWAQILNVSSKTVADLAELMERQASLAVTVGFNEQSGSVLAAGQRVDSYPNDEPSSSGVSTVEAVDPLHRLFPPCAEQSGSDLGLVSDLPPADAGLGITVG